MKRHTAVDLLYLLKVRNTLPTSAYARELGFWSFPGKCSRGDRAPEKRKVESFDSVPDHQPLVRLTGCGHRIFVSYSGLFSGASSIGKFLCGAGSA
jgi:hypothetical protein